MRNNDYLEKYINSLEKNLYPNITYLIKNQDKIKRVIDKLLDEDYEDEKDNKNKK